MPRARLSIHDAGFYRSDDEFLRMLLAFVEDGARYTSSARTLRAHRDFIETRVVKGATRVRFAGGLPHPGEAATSQGWDRCESAVNTIWDDLAARSPCLYDGRTALADILDVVRRTHRHCLDDDGEPVDGPDFDDVDRFVPNPIPPDPLQIWPPVAEMSDPTPAAARHRLAEVGEDVLDLRDLESLLVGVSEAVTNAFLHGSPPTTVRIWADRDRVVVTVEDRGRGPLDPLAGLRPGTDGTGGGAGLWLTHMICDDVAMNLSADGFSIRLRAVSSRQTASRPDPPR